MAKQSYYKASVVINGVDISDHVRRVTIETEREEFDFSGFGGDYKEIGFGMGDVTITMEVHQDFAAGETHATLFSLSTTQTPFTVAIKPVATTVAATNPEFQMTALMGRYTPFDAAVGSADPITVTLRNASQTGLVADTTP